MSFLNGLGGLGGLLGGSGGIGGALGSGNPSGNQLVVFSNPRSIGQIVIDCTLQETATDELEITQHPVQNSANITDHAIVKPCMITFRALWSNSSTNGNGDPGYALDIYNQLLQLQQSRQPVQVATGKRNVMNALIKTLAWANDHLSDQALIMDITIQEIILVQTAQTTLAPLANQSNPAGTGGVSNTGTIQPLASQADINALNGG